MIRSGLRLARYLAAEKKVLPYLRHSVAPSLLADRAQRRPIFVMSTASSGSTWIASLLGHLQSHVFIHEVKLYGGNSAAFFDALKQLGPLVPDRFLYVLLETYERARLWTLESHANRLKDRPELLAPANLKDLDVHAPQAGHARYEVVDSSGSHLNIIPLLRRAYPKAVFTYVVRDPRDVVLSIRYRKPFGKNLTVEYIAQNFVDTYAKCRAVRDTHHVDVIRYEDWLADTETELRAFLARHELAMTDAQLRDAVFAHDATAMRAGKTARLGNLASAKAAGWRGELTADDKARIKPILDPLLLELGYEPNTSW